MDKLVLLNSSKVSSSY